MISILVVFTLLGTWFLVVDANH